MSHSQESKMSWSCLNTEEDLLKIFTGHIDLDVIKLVLDNRQNNLLLAHRDLLELTKTTNLEQNQYLSLNNEKDQTTVTIDSNNTKIIDWERLSQNETPTNRILYLVSKGFKVMVLMRGCPGSGKSYQATNILSKCYKNANVNNFIFSADQFFTDKLTGRYQINLSKLPKAHEWVFQNVQKAVQHEVTPIIIDNTNTKVWEMEIYLKLAVNNGYWIEILEPITEWAWDSNQLVKKNKHYVPYNTIISMINRYERVGCVDDLLTRLKLKYNKINQPPKLSKNAKKYQLCENIEEGKVINKPQIEINDRFINDNFKDLHVSQKKDNVYDIKSNSFNNSDEDPWGVSTPTQGEDKNSVLNEFENTSNDIPDDFEEDRLSSSSTEGASNYINKYVNTNENEFLFMEVLNEIPEEEYSSFVIFGTNRDINEGNSNVLNVPSGTLNKGTTTNDLMKITHQPSLNELRNYFPENVCLLIIEFFEKCEGNIDWVVSLLEEAGHFISKQQLYNLIQQEDSKSIESTNLSPTTETFTENRFNDTDGDKKKIEKKLDSTKKKLQFKDKSIKDTNLRTNIENKFVFSDSLYSEQLLKIKKFKENQATFDNNDIGASKSDIVEKDVSLKDNDKGKFVQLVVETSILTQLCDYFGDFSSDLSKSTLPMSVKLPEKLAEDLYYCLIANVPSGIMDQEVILQDEILARKLQEECEVECATGISISHPFTGEHTFAAVLSKKLLLDKFKHLDAKHVQNVLEANDCKLKDSCTEHNEFQSYTEEALGHAQMRQQYMIKANQSLRTKIHPAVVGYYNDKAEESKQKEKHAQYKALETMIEQNETGTSLDLHNLTVKNAIIILDLFLDNQIMNLKQLAGFGRGRQLTIITGRGKHSPNGIARIKPVVVRRLLARNLIYLEPEKPGFIMVIIKKNSLLNSEL